MDIQALKPKIAEIAQKYGLDLVVLFGSQATGRTHPKSDIDIGYTSLQDFELKTLFKIETELSRLFQRDDVELVNLRRISPVMKKIISDEAIVLFERFPGVFDSFFVYAFKLYVETRPLREARYQSLRRFTYGTPR